MSGMMVVSPTPWTMKSESLAVVTFWIKNGIGPNILRKAKRHMKVVRMMMVEASIVFCIFIFNFFLR